MNTIKFSHQYTKMPIKIPEKALLLEVFTVHYRDLSSVFKLYDTEIYPSGEHYVLPKTKLLVLLLLTESGDEVFTTIRRQTPQKEKYYRSLIGKEFQIVIDLKGDQP